MDFHDFPMILGNLGVETDHPPQDVCRPRSVVSIERPDSAISHGVRVAQLAPVGDLRDQRADLRGHAPLLLQHDLPRQASLHFGLGS